MWIFKRENKNKILAAVLLAAGESYAQAEVLVILPESGPMARAASSIKQGFISAYVSSGSSIPLKFVNSDQAQIQVLLKKNISKKTAMVVGPLGRADVDALLKSKPKLKVLALNEGSSQLPNVWQFSLAKKDDADALALIMKKDQIQELLVLRQQGAEMENELFFMALMSKTELPVQVINQAPEKLQKQQGLLLLGSNDWLLSHKKLPQKYIYTLGNALEQHKPLPRGIKFCDTPAVHEARWTDMKNAYVQNPVNLPYQRLLAFGGDAWQITSIYLQEPKMKGASFEGRSGKISIESGQIQRLPHCYLYHTNGLSLL